MPSTCGPVGASHIPTLDDSRTACWCFPRVRRVIFQMSDFPNNQMEGVSPVTYKTPINCPAMQPIGARKPSAYMIGLWDSANLCTVPKHRPVQCLAVPVALLALLMLVMVLGSVSHHHDRATHENCSICHLSHQPIDHPQPSHRETSLAQVGLQAESQEPGFRPSFVTPRLPARAPPAV